MRSRFSAVAGVTAALLMGVVGVASASAQSFSGAEGSLKAEATAPQVFHVGPAGTVECDALSATGTITKGAKATQDADVTYSECEAFGHPAEVTTADYEFLASGSVKILNTIKVTVTVKKVLECTVTIGTQTLSSIAYDNSTPVDTITLVPNITGITSSGVGTLCEYSSSKEGTYVGNSKVSDTGGTIEWIS